MSKPSFSAFFRGELKLQLRGERVGICLAQFQQNGILLQSVRVRATTAECVVLLSDFNYVYRICRQQGVKFRVSERHGLPFLGRKLLRRKTFVAGAALFVCMLYVLSSTIWRIDIVGPTDNEGQMEIRSAAKSAGLFVGQRTSKLSDLPTIQRDMLTKAPDFVWIGVRRQGSVARIQAIPRVEDVKEKVETPQNIVADRPGVVQTVTASRGRSVVKPNTYVKPGQVLISGTLSEGEANVPAEGQVMAEVWYKSQVSVPLRISHRGLTGESVRRDYLRIGRTRIRIWGFNEPHFADVYEQTSVTDWHIGRYPMPIQLSRVRIYQVTATAQLQSMQLAEKSALHLAASDVSGEVGTNGKVLGQSVLHHRVARGTLYETILTRVLQNVGVPVAIPAKMESKSSPIEANRSDGSN